jgi:uncharacterized protein with GYD domain
MRRKGARNRSSRSGAESNIALEPTAYSLRSFLASAFGGGSQRAYGFGTWQTSWHTALWKNGGLLPERSVGDRQYRIVHRRRRTMATFISLLKFTDQGVRNIKDSPNRYEAFRAMAEKLGVRVKDLYYTVGHYDIVAVMEGSDEAVTTALLQVCSLGNVRTETLRGFSLDDMKKMVGTMP